MSMKFKNGSAFLLLSIVSLYLLCPVICPALRGVHCEGSAQTPAQPEHPQFADGHTDSTACHAELPCHEHPKSCCDGRDSSKEPHHEQDSNDNCCFDRFAFLGTGELKPFQQTLEDIPSFGFLTPLPSTIPSATFSAILRPRFSEPYNQELLILPILPRAPPFAHA
jgi:hypothetical protein